MHTIHRTISDISFETTKLQPIAQNLPPISEIEEATCECCGMCEECTSNYIKKTKETFIGKLICGLCGEAVKDEMDKNGGNREKALNEHMSACARFNRFGRVYPVLYQADAIKELLKKSSAKAKPRENGRRGIGRSSSCITAIARDVGDATLVK